MNKGLKVVEETRNVLMERGFCQRVLDNLVIIEKELKGLEIIKQKGIAFLMPEGDYNNERIHIELYTNTLSEEELKMIKEILGL